MSAPTLETTDTTTRRPDAGVPPMAARPRERAVPARIPFGRVLGVELRKMFDTRTGAWLMASIVILALIASVATIVFAGSENLTYEAFSSAVGVPMSVLLPIIAILSVSSEWSQRTALTTFTLVPSRTRVLTAKLLLTLAMGLVAMLVAMGIGAVGNVVGSVVADGAGTWDIEFGEFWRVVLASEVGMLFGFMLGVLLRSSAAAIVAYFVYSLVLPTASGALAASQEWWADNAGWFDHTWATFNLYDGPMSAENWAQLGTTSLIWLVVPLAIGVRMLLRAEVK